MKIWLTGNRAVDDLTVKAAVQLHETKQKLDQLLKQARRQAERSRPLADARLQLMRIRKRFRLRLDELMGRQRPAPSVRVRNTTATWVR